MFLCYNKHINPILEKFMSEKQNPQHEKVKLILKIVGISLIVVGLAFTVIGFVDFFKTFSTRDGFPKKFWCCFVGLPLFGIGLGLTTQAFRREIGKFVATESVPAADTLLRGVTPAMANMANEMKDSEANATTCECGAQNDENDKFCKNCGKSLTTLCPDCGERLNGDSKFCTNCGKKL